VVAVAVVVPVLILEAVVAVQEVFVLGVVYL
jgi:hypothetical protein